MKTILQSLFKSTIVKAINYTHANISNDYIYKKNLHSLLWERALVTSAEYVEENIKSAVIFKNKEELWEYAISQIKNSDQGSNLEFGVYNGYSINFFSERCPDKEFFGFDSFEGLAEDWSGHHSPKGTFNLGGSFPKVNKNVRLIKGWFHESLPKFLNEKKLQSLSILHIDSDTYEAAIIILKELEPFIKKGVYVIFDEYIGYPNWQNGEYKAWQEFTKNNSISYMYKAFSTEQVLIKIL